MSYWDTKGNKTATSVSNRVSRNIKSVVVRRNEDNSSFKKNDGFHWSREKATDDYRPHHKFRLPGNDLRRKLLTPPPKEYRCVTLTVNILILIYSIYLYQIPFTYVQYIYRIYSILLDKVILFIYLCSLLQISSY